jgi:hypothetical protein
MQNTSLLCLASRKPVAVGERCVVLPLVQRASIRARELELNGVSVISHGIATSDNRTNCFWTPFSGFLDAVHLGDCQFSLGTDEVTHIRALHFVNELRRLSPSTLAGPNEQHEPAFNLKRLLMSKYPDVDEALDAVAVGRDAEVDLTALHASLQQVWSNVVEATNRFRVFALRTIGEMRPVQLTVLRYDIYHSLVAMTASRLASHADGLRERRDRLVETSVGNRPHIKGHLESWSSARLEWEEYCANFHDSLIPFPSEHLELELAHQKVRTLAGRGVTEFLARVENALHAHMAIAGLDMTGTVLNPMTRGNADASTRFRTLLTQ